MAAAQENRWIAARAAGTVCRDSALSGRGDVGFPMNQTTMRYATAASILLAAMAITASAFAEGGQYQKPAAPVSSGDRLPGVIQLEKFLADHGVTGLDTVRGPSAERPAPPAQPARAAAPAIVQPAAAAEPVEETPIAPAAQPATPSAAGMQPIVSPPAQPAAEPSVPRAAESRPADTTLNIPAASTAFQAPSIEDQRPAAGDSAGAAPDAAVLYAPPVRAPWWERLLASRGFLYATIFCLLVVPAAGFIASGMMSRRREERDLALYD